MRVTSDTSGTIVGQQGHYPFGELWYQTGSNPPFVFTSYYRDSDAGLDYAMNRFYSHRLGRFQTADPMDLVNVCTKPGHYHRTFRPNGQTPQETHLYAYAVNDPANNADPLGLDHDPFAAPFDAETHSEGGGGTAWGPFWWFDASVPGSVGFAMGFQPWGPAIGAWASAQPNPGDSSQGSISFNFFADDPFSPCKWCKLYCQGRYYADQGWCAVGRIGVEVILLVGNAANPSPFGPSVNSPFDMDAWFKDCLFSAYREATGCLSSCRTIPNCD